MKVFTDKLEMSFFKTDEYIKNLHVIEINTIKDFVFRLSLDPLILLGAKSWMIGRFDELISGNPEIDYSEEPELHGEWLTIDFLEDKMLLDILSEIMQYISIDSSFLSEIKDFGVFSKMKQEWINEDQDEQWTIEAWNDQRRLIITIDSNDQVTMCVDELNEVN